MPLAPRLQNLGVHTFPVSTKVERAQLFMNQGLNLVYGFNHAEAARAFAEAARLDPTLAMAYWGQALVLGPNINAAMDPANEPTAQALVQKAVAMKSSATPREQAYIDALAARYTGRAEDRRTADRAYAEALARVVKAFPDDLDARTLQAEALMDLRPWNYWTRDGVAYPETVDVQASLEHVLAAHQNHPGALHLWIHLWEPTDTPERAEAEADRLLPLMPGAGHIVHMPAHIYMRVGDYKAAARSNDLAAAADRDYFKASELRGIYSAAYYSHNLHFLAAARSMQGRYSDSLRAARQLEENVRPYLKEMPFFESFLPTATLTMVRFGRWDEVLREPEPPASQPITHALWRWAHGMAYAASDKVAEAEKELKTYHAEVAAIPAEAGYGQNTARDVLKIGEHFLNARISSARGDRKGAVEHLRRAVAAEDALAYDEPPGWYHPLSRESLGGALMAAGEHAEAERVFREDLRRNRRNGRSLFGLAESLKAQGKTYEERLVRREFERAWKGADTRLSVSDL
jgi:tetratricopeptide (TPR) repeat protein